jgi:hypothetical protein
MTAAFNAKDASRGSILQRRKIGAYYTPRHLADILCTWTIRSPSDTVLEPSFGGCDFIAAAKARLDQLGNNTPWKSIVGADVDPFAFSVLKELGASEIASQNFKLADFLSLKPLDFPVQRVDALVCNPPYVRHHAVSAAQQLIIRELRDRELPSLSLQANLWAFFVLHGCSFLKEGGRAAWVLPHSFLHATYAAAIRKHLLSHFRSLTATTIRERLFRGEGADEGTVVILADGWSTLGANAQFQSYSVDSTSKMQRLLANQEGLNSPRDQMARVWPWLGMQALGDICEFRIGIVTGDSGFFLFDSQKAARHDISGNSLRLIVSKARLVSGLAVNRSDVEEAFKAGERAAILDTTVGVTPAVAEYLCSKMTDEIASNATFAKRPIWHQPFGGQPPDAFFTGMSHLAPRLVLNSDGLDCTNTLYRVRFLDAVPVETRRLVALCLISTPGQLSAELEGRPYGAGLLKHEPSDARRIKVFTTLLPQYGNSLLDAFGKVDKALKRGNRDAAVEQADQFLIRHEYLTADQRDLCRSRLLTLRKRRHG